VPNTAALYENDEIRNAISGMVRPLAKHDIRDLSIRKGKKTINSVTKADLPPEVTEVVQNSDKASAKTNRDSREAVLRVTRANFEKGKWGFSDGAASFNADIAGESFKDKLDAREIGFYKGDTLGVILTVTQIIASDGQPFRTEYEIEKVIQHNHAPKQPNLLE
jgi:hypothetical protein